MNKQDVAQIFGGMGGWEFGGNASFDGLVDYVFENSNSTHLEELFFMCGSEKDDVIRSLTSDYLTSVGEHAESYI